MLILNIICAVFAFIIARKFERNIFVWPLICLIIPMALLILIQKGHKSNPDLIINIKSISIRAVLIVLIFFGVACIKEYPMDYQLRTWEVKLLTNILPIPTVAEGTRILASNANIELPEGVLNTVVAVGVWGMIFGLCLFYGQPWVTLKMGAWGLILGAAMKIIKDFLFCFILFIYYPAFSNEGAYFTATKVSVFVCYSIIFVLAIRKALQFKNYVKSQEHAPI